MLPLKNCTCLCWIMLGKLFRQGTNARLKVETFRFVRSLSHAILHFYFSFLIWKRKVEKLISQIT